MRYIYALCLSLFALSCVPETPVVTDYAQNYEALWSIIDENYCYLDEKGIDWDEIHSRYADSLRIKHSKMTDVSFFHFLTQVLQELKDGHVNLMSSFNVGRYTAWSGSDPTIGHNVYHRAKFLGTDYLTSGGMRYIKFRVTDYPDKLFGYISYPSFLSSLGDMGFILRFMHSCDAIILDVRGNGGGLVDNADKLVSYFTDEKTLVGYSSHKTGKGRNDFSKPVPQYIHPNKNVRWTKKPLVVLQDRACYSACNDFLYKLKAASKNAVTIGLPSGGGGGMPSVSELPNGWRVRYSAVKSYDKDMRSVEGGISPDIPASNTSYEVDPKAHDNILRRALIYLLDIDE